MKRTRILASTLMIVLAAQILHAQQSGWEVSIGAGLGGENVYLGSDDNYITPLPGISASYTSGNINYSLSTLEGLGVTYMNPKLGLMAGVNINAGAARHSEKYKVMGVSVKYSAKTKALLAGSPNLNTPVVVNANLSYLSHVGLFGVSMGIHPTSVKFGQTARKDETRSGKMYSLLYMVGGNATKRLSVSGLLSVDFMDQSYADTWFSVDQPTSSLSAYHADAGMRSSQIALEVKYRISKHVSLSTAAATTVLMGDAKDSPYTAESVQRAVTTQVLYHF